MPLKLNFPYNLGVGCGCAGPGAVFGSCGGLDEGY